MDSPSILIIDDDPGLRKTLTDILKLKGYDAHAAKDGAEGLAMFEAQKFNLVFIDLGLPDITGIELLRKIKETRPATEAIILTGNATLDAAIEATNKGAFSFVLKPYDIDQLLLNIKRAIEKQKAQEEITQHAFELEKLNSELQALYDVSSAASKSIDMEKLLTEILRALAGTKIFPFEIKGAIFLVDGDQLRRASFVSLSETEVEPCGTVSGGECLCGTVVTSGQVLVSKDSREDPRHTICDSRLEPHGHIIVPLKSVGGVIGVLSLYTKTGLELSERFLNLLATIGNQIGLAVENAKRYEETKSSSLHDPLTGLANRRFLQEQLSKNLESAKRYNEELSVIMLDIDHFKKYNDTYGHLEGDKLLVNIARILLKVVRKADYVFRYGGEEFCVILPATNLAMACEAAERLRKAVEAESGGVTISLGAASLRAGRDEMETLIGAADAALYRAKENGRNRVEKTNDS